MACGEICGISDGVFAITAFVWYVLRMVAYWKVFVKFGEPGWKTLIPFYNLYIQYKYTWKANRCWLVLIPAVVGAWLAQGTGAMATLGNVLIIAGGVLSVVGLHKLSKSFGHGSGFTVGLILCDALFAIILGFGKSRYIGNMTEQ